MCKKNQCTCSENNKKIYICMHAAAVCARRKELTTLKSTRNKQRSPARPVRRRTQVAQNNWGTCNFEGRCSSEGVAGAVTASEKLPLVVKAVIVAAEPSPIPLARWCVVLGPPLPTFFASALTVWFLYRLDGYGSAAYSCPVC